MRHQSVGAHHSICCIAAIAVACFAGSSAVAVTISPTGDATNVTEQIQAAINNAPNGTVTLAAGTYRIIRAITISNGASLVGGGSTPKDVVLSLATRTAADGDWNVISIESSANTIVSNLTVTTREAKWDNGFGPKGAISMNSGLVVDCVVRDCTTHNNAYSGGGVNMTGGTMRRCLVAYCNANDSGGGGASGEGIYMTGGLVENCTVVSNGSTNASYMGSTGSGGAVYVKNGVLRNCLVVNNWNRVGSSGVTVRENATVENCTIAYNMQNCAVAVAKGVDFSGTGITFRNNIVWGNTAYDGSLANYNFAAGVNNDAFVYNDTKPLVVGTGNISVDPEFVDVANGDYHTAYTYCTDAGTTLGWMDGAVDLDGNARVRNSHVDMGCYEREAPTGFACRMNLVSDDGTDLANVTVECGDSANTANSATWTFKRVQDDHVVNATGLSASLQLPTGTWNVRVDISNGHDSDVLEKLGAVVVQASKVYVNASGSSEFPYDTVEKGLPSIIDALQSLGPGGTIYVAEGSYVISSSIKLVDERGSRIVSLAGPEKTIVRIDNATPFNSDDGEHGLHLACDTAYVSGLTFVAGRNGPYYTGEEYTSRGLLKMRAAGAVVTNCVFRDLKCRNRIWGNGLDIKEGTVVDCLFTRIDSFSSGGAVPQGGVLCIQGGLVDRTRIVECWARESNTGDGGKGDVIGVWGSGTLRNSLVTRCTSEHDTPIYIGVSPSGGKGGHLENCTILANTNLHATIKEKFWFAGGVIVNGGSITNCIVVDNWSVFGNAVSNIYNEAGADGIGYSLVNDRAGDATFVTAANHNINVQPGTQLFRIPEKGNFTPRNNSPAVDSAFTLAWMETARDLAGGPRIVDRIPDIGCYEASPQGFSIRLR